MTIVDSAGRSGDDATFVRFGWRRSVAAHLAPGALAFVVALALAPLMVRLGLPTGFALTVAFAVVLTPVELGLLLSATHRATGRWSVRALPSVIAYRKPLGRWWWLVLPLFALAVLVLLALTPVADALGGLLHGLLPGWMLPDYDGTAGFAKPVLVATLLITLVVDGLVNPTVEELYFRGYLLPRLPVSDWRAVLVSAALFAGQHYWQPYNWVLIFVLQVILTALVVRLRRLRLGIVIHVLANCFGTVLTLLAVLT